QSRKPQRSRRSRSQDARPLAQEVGHPWGARSSSRGRDQDACGDSSRSSDVRLPLRGAIASRVLGSPPQASPRVPERRCPRQKVMLVARSSRSSSVPQCVPTCRCTLERLLDACATAATLLRDVRRGERFHLLPGACCPGGEQRQVVAPQGVAASASLKQGKLRLLVGRYPAAEP